MLQSHVIFLLVYLLTNKHVLNLYIPDRSPVRFEPTYKMDASNENFDILSFVYMLVFLLTFLFFFLVFSISFCFACLGFGLPCLCHKASEFEEYQLKTIVKSSRSAQLQKEQSRIGSGDPHHLGMNYYVNFLGCLVINGFQLK